jgi:putative MFS transporter
MNDTLLNETILTPATSPGTINARLDRLPVTRAVWLFVILLSLGGWFEFYDLFLTAYVGPGLVRDGLLTSSTQNFFGFSGLGAFVAANFAGLFIGTAGLGWLADRFGRRWIFTAALLWYSFATIVMAFQTTSLGVDLWRLIAGIGIGMELVTIDTYLAELVPRQLRGRAFVINQSVQYTAVPVVALLAYWLVPRIPFGFDGWRWVVLIGAAGALAIWVIRLRLPESPRSSQIWSGVWLPNAAASYRRRCRRWNLIASSQADSSISGNRPTGRARSCCRSLISSRRSDIMVSRAGCRRC